MERDVFSERDIDLLDRFYVAQFIGHQFFSNEPKNALRKRGGDGRIPHGITVNVSVSLYREFRRFSPGRSVVDVMGLAASMFHDVFEDTWLGSLRDQQLLEMLGLSKTAQALQAIEVARVLTRFHQCW